MLWKQCTVEWISGLSATDVQIAFENVIEKLSSSSLLLLEFSV